MKWIKKSNKFISLTDTPVLKAQESHPQTFAFVLGGFYTLCPLPHSIREILDRLDD